MGERREIDWAEDHLRYGYVIARLPDREWWHMHLGRSEVIEYDCALLGERTDVFAVVQRLAPGCVARSQQFVLTLDGEGVDRRIADLRVDFGWEVDANATAAGRRFQAEVMPLLYDSAPMQTALAAVVQRGRYLQMREPNTLRTKVPR
jgi:hypothetical protein